MLRDFRHINILGFILYFVVLCIFLILIVKLSSLPVVFFPQGFLCKYDVFLYFCNSLLCR